MKKPGVTRREVVIGGTAALAACGRTAPYDLAASGSEEQMQSVGNDPIHLTATTSIGANSQGGVNAIALKNPSGEAMELLQVKWSLSAAAGAAIAGGSVGCKLELGSIPLTNGFVPIWSFGPTTDISLETTTSGARSTLVYDWKLDRPLHIPAGAVVVPTFQHRGLISQPIDVRVSYSCRTVPQNRKPSAKHVVPWVSYYASKVFDVLDAADTDQSIETDLINKWNTPIQVHRFVGRANTFNASLALNTEAENGAGHLSSVRIMSSKGEPIVPRVTPFRQVFSAVSRAWEVPHELEPHGFYSVFVSKNAPTTPLAADTFLGQLFISMIASREVEG